MANAEIQPAARCFLGNRQDACKQWWAISQALSRGHYRDVLARRILGSTMRPIVLNLLDTCPDVLQTEASYIKCCAKVHTPQTSRHVPHSLVSIRAAS